jgi:hypothetical protein
VTLTGIGIQVRRCPVKEITQASNSMLEAYLMFEKGYLPNPGGWLEQPMKFSEIMFFIDNLIAKMQKEKDGQSKP